MNFTLQAQTKIAEAERYSAEMGVAFEVGFLRGALKSMAADANLACQIDQITARISRTPLTPDQISDLIDALTNSLRESNPDATDALEALKWASESVSDLNDVDAMEVLEAYREAA